MIIQCSLRCLRSNHSIIQSVLCRLSSLESRHSGFCFVVELCQLSSCFVRYCFVCIVTSCLLVWGKTGCAENCSSWTDHWGLAPSLHAEIPKIAAEINIFTGWFTKKKKSKTIHPPINFCLFEFGWQGEHLDLRGSDLPLPSHLL